MKIHLQFIDNKGFIHFASCNGKRKAIESLKFLKQGTEIRWTGPDTVFVSQQYIK